MQTYFKNYPMISYAIIAIEEQMFSDVIIMYVMQVNYDLLFHIYNFFGFTFFKSMMWKYEWNSKSNAFTVDNLIFENS